MRGTGANYKRPRRDDGGMVGDDAFINNPSGGPNRANVLNQNAQGEWINPDTRAPNDLSPLSRSYWQGLSKLKDDPQLQTRMKAMSAADELNRVMPTWHGRRSGGRAEGLADGGPPKFPVLDPDAMDRAQWAGLSKPNASVSPPRAPSFDPRQMFGTPPAKQPSAKQFGQRTGGRVPGRK
jgi:hypothetical protein